jgi:hypothetical protein
MLEIAEDLDTVGLKPCNIARKAKVLGFRPDLFIPYRKWVNTHTPLSPQVAGLSTFLTGSGQ